MSLFYMEIRYKSDLHLSGNNLYMHCIIVFLKNYTTKLYCLRHT